MCIRCVFKKVFKPLPLCFVELRGHFGCMITMCVIFYVYIDINVLVEPLRTTTFPASLCHRAVKSSSDVFFKYLLCFVFFCSVNHRKETETLSTPGLNPCNSKVRCTQNVAIIITAVFFFKTKQEVLLNRYCGTRKSCEMMRVGVPSGHHSERLWHHL